MFEEFSLAPASFFQIEWDCPRLPKTKTLPDLSYLFGENSFADIAMGWSADALEFQVDVQEKIDKVFFPEVTKGDSIELFIDTRDVKTSGYNTRFCHHFFFLPEAMEGKQAGECTRFRTDDKHDWCDPAELGLKIKRTAKGYTAKIVIPASCLNGYDPQQRARIGFSYRINRYGQPSQHFSVDSADYQIEQQPSLWSSIHLII